MAVPQNARMGYTMLGELVKWYEFAGKIQGNQILPRNGHNRSLHDQYQVLSRATPPVSFAESLLPKGAKRFPDI